MSQVYLSFYICKELFAINVQKVLEVLQKQEITPIPNAPDFITGIINFRGEVVPVFDTRIKFNLPKREENDTFVIAILDLIKDNQPYLIGAVVDHVRDVISFNDNDIKPVPRMSNTFDTKFLSGIVKQQEKFILLIDVDHVFTDEEIQYFANAANGV